jgi:hypothetical protein
MALAKGNFHAFIVRPSFKSPIVITFAFGLIRCKESIILLFRAPASLKGLDFSLHPSVTANDLL